MQLKDKNRAEKAGAIQEKAGVCVCVCVQIKLVPKASLIQNIWSCIHNWLDISSKAKIH